MDVLSHGVVLSLIHANLLLDQAISEFHTVKGLPLTPEWHRESVQNWISGHKPLVRSESRCYLNASEYGDLVTIGPGDPDRAIPETLLDIGVKAFPGISKYVSSLALRITPQLVEY